MEPPPPALPTAASSKLRLMCSYGGHIAPRPHAKSLFYSGGDTRIVSIPAASAAALSSFTAALSSALSVSAPFTLKYQLPGHDLDSLISLSTDDDLLVLLDELPRLPPLSRIRVFLFPPKPAIPESTHPELAQSVLCHPKTETWFIDALNSARMMQKGENCAAGFGQNESFTGGGGCGPISGAESIVLETNSSFGSTSSSVSLTNLPSGRPQDEDNGNNFLEYRDNRGANTAFHPSVYHEQVIKLANFDTRAAQSTAFEHQNNTVPFPSLTPSYQTAPISGFPAQPLGPLHHFVPAGPMYLPQQQQQHTVCLVPISSTQPVYQLNPQIYHPTNAPHPFYNILPSNPNFAQPYGLSVQCGLSGTTGQPHSSVSPMPAPREVDDACNPGSLCKSNPQECADLHQGQEIVQPVDSDQGETWSPRNEFDDDDPAHLQIYKSQPPLPTLPSQFQTVTKTSTLMLSEAFAQLHTDGIRKQVTPSQQQ